MVRAKQSDLHKKFQIKSLEPTKPKKATKTAAAYIEATNTKQSQPSPESKDEKPVISQALGNTPGHFWLIATLALLLCFLFNGFVFSNA